uniref:Dynactin subunit 4 n=1 Tax=Ursus americanus TaxID=9643 RepID=A0A452QH66_URSAM
MASLLQSERVLYLVQGEKKVRAPLSQLYFCRYCSELRSLECVSHEVMQSSREECVCVLGEEGGRVRPSHRDWRVVIFLAC